MAPFAYRLEDYLRYRERVGEATYIDVTRRTDPARVPRVWDNLREIVESCGPPWVVQVWTKDIEGALRLGGALLSEIRAAGTTVAAQITVTGMAGTVREPVVPIDAMGQLPRLAEAIGGLDHIAWRYDPIIPGVHDSSRFRALAQRAAQAGISRGVLNFVAPPGRYARVDRRLASLLPGWADGMPDYDEEWRASTARELVAISGDVGISLACCAEYAHLSGTVPGLGRAACGDYVWFAALSGRQPIPSPYRGSRAGCGCARYFDVGYYGQWQSCHRCVYCYAG